MPFGALNKQPSEIVKRPALYLEKMRVKVRHPKAQIRKNGKQKQLYPTIFAVVRQMLPKKNRNSTPYK